MGLDDSILNGMEFFCGGLTCHILFAFAEFADSVLVKGSHRKASVGAHIK
jgi:hypothetical protein